MPSTATGLKRSELLTYIQREVTGEPAVQAVIAVGSVATGHARPDSDIDAFVFLDPFDLYVVPAEFKWRSQDGSLHGISAYVDDAIQFDFHRYALSEWSNPAFEWPEPARAELSDGWIAFDRHGAVGELIAVRTVFTHEVRQARLDQAVVQLDQLLTDYKVERAWDTLGPAYAHDRLNAAYDNVVQALFAYNWKWRPWRSREMAALTQLAWLPERFTEDVLIALTAPSLDEQGYRTRVTVLIRLFRTLVEQLVRDGFYQRDATSEAFIRQHSEPGRDWNMDEWRRLHRQRKSFI